MSALLDLLERLARSPSVPMGFGALANRESQPTMALLAWVAEPETCDLAAFSASRVDGVVLHRGLRGPEGVKEMAQGVQGLPWGVAVEGLDRDRWEAYRAEGCDFLVFGLEGTRAEALAGGEVARVLRIPPALEESRLRSLEELPVDVVLLQRPSGEGPLTLEHLVSVATVRASLSKYLLLEWEASLTSQELELLRDQGVDGLVVDAGVGEEALAQLRERLNRLPRRKPRPEAKHGALLPRVASPSAPPRREEEEEEEEEEEF